MQKACGQLHNKNGVVNRSYILLGYPAGLQGPGFPWMASSLESEKKEEGEHIDKVFALV